MAQQGGIDSPFVLMTRLGSQVGATLVALDIEVMGKGERKIVETIRRLLIDTRLDIRDYELSETRAEQIHNRKTAHAGVEQLRSNVLLASEHDIFGAIDVAQLSAQLDEIVANLR